MIVVALLVALLYWWILMQAEFEPVVVWLMVAIILLISSFTTLTVTIDESYLRVKFGWGIYRKRFALNEIQSATSVKNHWYNGWGIRFWPKPPTWIFNVSGFAAVELIMKNGKRFRIGTDEPRLLQQALERAISLKR